MVFHFLEVVAESDEFGFEIVCDSGYLQTSYIIFQIKLL